MLSESDFTEEERAEPGFAEWLATMNKAEEIMVNALLIENDDAAVAYLVAAEFGSDLTCGMMLSRARGGAGDLIDLAS